MQPLEALSPLDGRYRRQTEPLALYFSEGAVIRYRVMVEVEYFIALCELPLPALATFDKGLFETLRDIYRTLDTEKAMEVKEIEKTTNHDVKAIEYFIKRRFDALDLGAYKEYIHFGLTSQDINNTAFPCALRDALNEQFYPLLDRVVETLSACAEKWRDVPMLARTHGQPASPTRLGKEIEVFVYRLKAQYAQLRAIPVSGKFGGATGNFNAHHVAFPAIDWTAFANGFLAKKLGIEREQWTTQISNYDNLAAIFDAMQRINAVLIDFDRDIWSYISMNYFKQAIKAGEVGSSAMPHKVNPIDFENSEGNLGMANAIFDHLSRKLPISRLQRDLTDSTVIRNIGVPLGHTLLAFHSTLKGVGKLILHEETILSDLEDNWAVVAEAIQTILRREEYPNPYEALKALTRTNTKITREAIASFIETLEVSEEVKSELRAITPQNYCGL